MDEIETGLSEIQDLQDDEEPPSCKVLSESFLKVRDSKSFYSSQKETASPKTVTSIASFRLSNNHLLLQKNGNRAASQNGISAIPCFIDGTSGGF